MNKGNIESADVGDCRRVVRSRALILRPSMGQQSPMGSFWRGAGDGNYQGKKETLWKSSPEGLKGFVPALGLPWKR